MNRRTILLALSILSLLALADRIGLAVYQRAWKTPNPMEHRSIAAAIAAGRGFTFGDWGYYGPTSVQSPPFPFYLAGLFKIFHVVQPDATLIEANAYKAYFTAMVINAIAGAALVWVTYFLTLRLGGSALAGLLAAALVSIWPTQVYAARSVQAISLITLGLTAMTLLYYISIDTGKTAPWVIFSVLGALVTLTEPVVLPAMAVTMLLVLCARSLNTSAKLRNVAILAFAMAALIGPWTLRNYIVHGKIMPIKGSFWVNMWKGNNEYATGTDRLKMTPAEEHYYAKHAGSTNEDDLGDTHHMYDMLDPSQRQELNNKPEAVRDDMFKKYTMKFLSEHPGRYVQLCAIRLYKTIVIDWDNPRSHNIIYIAGRVALLLLTAAGLVVVIRQRWRLLFPMTLIGCALLTYTLTITAARFAIPFEPIQLTWGGAFLAMLLPGGLPQTRVSLTHRGFGPVIAPTT